MLVWCPPDIPDSLPWPDDKTISFMETNIVSQDNSATPLLNFGASQLRAARSDDGLQLNAEGKQGQICHSVFFFLCVCV